MGKYLNTKFGKAKINNNGYYIISSAKEGNHGKLLHRLIFEDYYGVTLLANANIHHINGCKTDNNINNLEMMTWEDHGRFHVQNRSEETLNKIREASIGRKHSKETRIKISESKKGQTHSKEARMKMSKSHLGKKLSDEHKYNISQSQNSTGYFRVHKEKNPRYKQGFFYRYSYLDEDKKPKKISSVSIEKLKEKVIARGLEWIDYTKED